MLYYWSISYIQEIIKLQLINRNHIDLIASYFRVEKIYKLIAKTTIS